MHFVFFMTLCCIVLYWPKPNYLQVLKPDEPTTEGYNAESVQTVKQRGQDRQPQFWEKV